MNLNKNWQVDPNNCFQLDENHQKGLAIITIQIFSEIGQQSLEEINYREFLDLYTDLDEKLGSAANISVAKIFTDWLGYDITGGNTNFYYRVSIEQVYEYILEYLYERCINTPTIMFADLSAYGELYEERLSEFKMYLPAEVDESDFIRSEIDKCFAVKLELEKPLYYIKYPRDAQNFNSFATLLGSRIDKRISFLEKKLERRVDPVPNSYTHTENLIVSSDDVSARVRKHFGFFQGNCPRKHKQILKDGDFENLLIWTTYYFENNFAVPEILQPIKTVNTNKSFVQLAFRYLFKELHPNTTLPYSLYELYTSAFQQFSSDTMKNFGATRNNDEVKKMMLLDY